jgi:hypothetical protein
VASAPVSCLLVSINPFQPSPDKMDDDAWVWYITTSVHATFERGCKKLPTGLQNRWRGLAIARASGAVTRADHARTPRHGVGQPTGFSTAAPAARGQARNKSTRSGITPRANQTPHRSGTPLTNPPRLGLAGHARPQWAAAASSSRT